MSEPVEDDEADEEAFARALDCARAGEARGYDALVRLVDRRLVGFARARGAEDPEGLANDVLVRMCRSVDAFEGTLPQFRAWVFTIARHRIIDERRRRARRPDAAPTAPDQLPDGVGAALDDVVGDVGGRERIDALLEGLTGDQREVIVLRIVVGLSVEETAEVVGRRPGAVRALQHRALRQLRAAPGDAASRPPST